MPHLFKHKKKILVLLSSILALEGLALYYLYRKSRLKGRIIQTEKFAYCSLNDLIAMDFDKVSFVNIFDLDIGPKQTKHAGHAELDELWEKFFIEKTRYSYELSPYDSERNRISRGELCDLIKDGAFDFPQELKLFIDEKLRELGWSLDFVRKIKREDAEIIIRQIIPKLLEKNFDYSMTAAAASSFRTIDVNNDGKPDYIDPVIYNLLDPSLKEKIKEDPGLPKRLAERLNSRAANELFLFEKEMVCRHYVKVVSFLFDFFKSLNPELKDIYVESVNAWCWPLPLPTHTCNAVVAFEQDKTLVSLLDVSIDDANAIDYTNSSLAFALEWKDVHPIYKAYHSLSADEFLEKFSENQANQLELRYLTLAALRARKIEHAVNLAEKLGPKNRDVICLVADELYYEFEFERAAAFYEKLLRWQGLANLTMWKKKQIPRLLGDCYADMKRYDAAWNVYSSYLKSAQESFWNYCTILMMERIMPNVSRQTILAEHSAAMDTAKSLYKNPAINNSWLECFYLSKFIISLKKIVSEPPQPSSIEWFARNLPECLESEKPFIFYRLGVYCYDEGLLDQSKHAFREGASGNSFYARRCREALKELFGD